MVTKLLYLVGGLRISIGEGSTTPGPRSHILGFLDGCATSGVGVSLYMASEQPGLRGAAKMKEGAGQARLRSDRLPTADLLRLAAGLWSGVRAWRLHRSDDVIAVYERAAVYQCLHGFIPRRGKKIIVESNGIMSRETFRDRSGLRWVRLAEAIERLTYRRADLVVAVSPGLRAELIEFAGLPKHKVVVVPNAIPHEMRRLARRPVGDALCVGFVGSVVLWQQLPLLLRAATRVYSEGAPPSRRLRIEVIGDGPALGDLEAARSSLPEGVELILAGRLTRDESWQRMTMWHYGYSGHAATSSSTMYHSPLKLYEYAGMGMEAICTSSPDASVLGQDGMPLHVFATELDLVNLLRVLASGGLPEDDPAWREKVLNSHSWGARVTEVLTAAGLQEDRAAHSTDNARKAIAGGEY